MNGKNISLCKKLQYAVLYNKKLDWLKREKYWKFDRIDRYFGIVFVSMLILTNIFGEVFILPTFLVFYIGSIMGHIRHIKGTPGDIESKLMSPLMCIGFSFLIFTLIIAIFVLIGKFV